MKKLINIPYRIKTAGIKIHEVNPYSNIEQKTYRFKYEDVGFKDFTQANYILDTFFIEGVTKYDEYKDYVKDNPSLFLLSDRTDYEGWDVTHNGFIWLCRGTLYDKYDGWDFDMYCDEDQCECYIGKVELKEINSALNTNN